MDHITDFYNYEPAIALLYFLVFLIPFAGAMFYMIRQHKRWKKQYDGLYSRVWKMAADNEVSLEITQKDQLGNLITDKELKQLEDDIKAVEQKVGVGKQAVIAHKYAPKPKKMQWLEKRIKQLEGVVMQEALA